jgi:hypothetical protein
LHSKTSVVIFRFQVFRMSILVKNEATGPGYQHKGVIQQPILFF